MPAKQTVSVRLDAELDATVAAESLGRPRREAPDRLVFHRARQETAMVTGDPKRLDLLEELVGGRAPDDLFALVLPRDVAQLDRLATERKKLVEDLLAEGRKLVERVERLVCALHDLPDELTEEVVAHAVARAAGSEPVDGE